MLFNSLKWMRGIRDLLGLAPLTPEGEIAWDAALGDLEDERLSAVLRGWLRTHTHNPTPAELRGIVEADAAGTSEAGAVEQQAL